MLLEIIVFACLLLGGALSIVHWLYSDLDRIARLHIDSFIDKLDDLLPPKAIQSVAERILYRLAPLLSRPFKVHTIVTSVSIFMNTLVYVVSLVASIQLHFPTARAGIAAFGTAVTAGGWHNFALMNILVAFVSAAVDNCSFQITHRIVHRVSTAPNGTAVAGWLFLDGLAVLAFGVMTYAILGVTQFLFYDVMKPIVASFSGGHPGLYMARWIWQTLEVNPVLWSVVVALAISSALPSIIFFIVVLPTLLLRSIKKYSPRLVGRILFTATVYRAPVFLQLAGFFGFIAAIVPATAYLVRRIVEH